MTYSVSSEVYIHIQTILLYNIMFAKGQEIV